MRITDKKKGFEIYAIENALRKENERVAQCAEEGMDGLECEVCCGEKSPSKCVERMFERP